MGWASQLVNLFHNKLRSHTDGRKWKYNATKGVWKTYVSSTDSSKLAIDGKAANSSLLDGYSASHFATKSELNNIDLSSKANVSHSHSNYLENTKSLTVDASGHTRFDPKGYNFEIDSDNSHRTVFDFNIDGTSKWAIEVNETGQSDLCIFDRGYDLNFRVKATQMQLDHSIKLGNDTRAASTAGAGALRWNGSKIQNSDGSEWKSVASELVTESFNYTGSPQRWNKPAGVTSIDVVIWGAGGGGGNPGGHDGGGGGFSSGTINVSNVSHLDFVVGQGGEGENSWFNTGNGNGCGGGLTGIFTTFDSDRVATHGRSVMIAGGGGGGGNSNGGGAGTGGGASGSRGNGGSAGHPGTQSAGGTIPNYGNGTCTSNCSGQQLRGGNGCGGGEGSYGDGGSWPSRYWGGVWSAGAGGNGCNAGGGGGGYWGGAGGGGSTNGGNGSGGSGYIGGHSTAPVSVASTSGNGITKTPAGTSNEYYPGGDIGYGASAELNGGNGYISITYWT